MMVATPPDYVASTVLLLKKHWHNRRQRFLISDIEALVGQLGHISETTPWLRFLLSHVYSSVAYALKLSKAHLLCTRKEFRLMIKELKKLQLIFNNWLKDHNSNQVNMIEINKNKSENQNLRHPAFIMPVTSKAIHKSRRGIEMNKTLREELRLIERALSSDWISLQRPISHMIKRDPSGIGYSDSCLRAAGGFSLDMKFWWYIEWPADVQIRTLRFIKNNKNDDLISINVLEYAALIINFMAATYFLRHHHDKRLTHIPQHYFMLTTQPQWHG